MGALVGAALRVNDLPLPLLDLNLSAQSGFSKIVLSPREDRGWEKYFPASPPLLFCATQRSRAFYLSTVGSCVHPGSSQLHSVALSQSLHLDLLCLRC